MKKLAILIAMTCTAVFIAIACGPGGAGGSYQGAGSYWTVVFGTGNTATFSYATTYGAAVSETINATYLRRSDGFLDFTVTAVTGTGFTVSVGDKAVGLELAGQALILKVGNNGKVIPLVVAGNCPTGTVTGNWIKITDTGGGINPQTQDTLGTFSWNAATGAFSLPSSYMITAPTTTVANNGAGNGATCSGGLAITSGGAKLYLTAAGGAIVDANGSAIIGTQAMTVNNMSSLSGNYAGLVLSNGGTNGNDTFPVQATVSGSTISFRNYAGNSLAGAVSTTAVGTATIAAVDSPSTGFIRGSLTLVSGGATVNIVCEASNFTGRNALFCIGIDPNTATKHFNLLLAGY
jgi:hypothetical protein